MPGYVRVILWHTGEDGVSPYPGAVPATTITDLLRLLTRDPGRPRLTWYGAGGERVELSGAVLDNWVSKTTNLLVEEFDAAPGTRVLLDLPSHWRTVVWALAAWRCGAHVVLDGPADVVVTTDPAAHAAGQVVAVTLPALARAFDGPLPPGAVDAASAVMTYGDVVGWAPAVVPDEPAFAHDGVVRTHADLVPDAAAAPTDAAPARVALTGSTAHVLARTLAVLATDGSVVVVADEVARELRDDDDRRARVLGSERVTADELG